jgi:hypothetical protein
MTHEELQQLLNVDIVPQPAPDPAWDYYLVWEHLNGVKDKINELIAFVSEQEYANEVTDTLIKGNIIEIGEKIEATEELI